MNGTTLADRYKIEAQIGIGGMGIVYRAHDTRLKREVALKVIAPHLVQHESARSQFLKEAQALAGLMHPNIVTVFDLAEDEDTSTVFIVMELLRGSSLRHCITESDRPPFSQVALPLCRALEAAHAKGVLHRDIKPENVFVCEDGTVKLMDFGLARLLSDASKSQASLIAGTLAYMAPEQLKGEKADFRSDLYSLGVLCYEYLCGTTPFDADNPGALLLKTLTEPAPPLRNCVPDLSPQLESVIMCLLEKEPAARFDSATALREALELPLTGERATLATTADSTLPAPRAAVAPTLTLPAHPSGETPTPVLTQTTRAVITPSRIPVRVSVPLRPALFGGLACVGILTLLFALPAYRRNAANHSNPTSYKSVAGGMQGGLVQMPNALAQKPVLVTELPKEEKAIESSQKHQTAKLDELMKQQEQTRSEVERLEKLLASEAQKRKAAEAKAAQSSLAAPSSGSSAVTAAPKVLPPDLMPLPKKVPEALAQLASLHPHDKFEFRTKPLVRMPDGSMQMQLHTAQECYLNFYLLNEGKNRAVLLRNGEMHMAAMTKRNLFSSVSLPMHDASTGEVKLLLLSSPKPLLSLPASFTLPGQTRKTSQDVSIDRRFALLHDFRDQVVTTLQQNHVQEEGKEIGQDDVIVRFLRLMPPAAPSSPPTAPSAGNKPQ